MDALAEGALRFLQTGENAEGAPSTPKLLRSLVALLRSYPGGLTEAVIVTELSKLVSTSRTQPSTRPANKRAAEDAWPNPNQENPTSSQPAPDSHLPHVVPLHRLIKLTQSSRLTWPTPLSQLQGAGEFTQQLTQSAARSSGPATAAAAGAGAVMAVASVHLMDCLTAQATTGTTAGTTAGTSPINGAGVQQVAAAIGGLGGAASSNGVWVCHLSDAKESGVLLRLYLSTQQNTLVRAAAGGLPWLQGKRIRLASLTLASCGPTPRTRSIAAERGSGQAARAVTAMPSPALLPLLTPQQWRDRLNVLQGLCGGQVTEVQEVVESVLRLMGPGATSVIDGWLVGRVQSVQLQPDQHQAVVMLCSCSPAQPSPATVQEGAAGELAAGAAGSRLHPVVAQGQQAAQQAGLLRPGDLLAVHSVTVQLQQQQLAGAAGGSCEAVLWVTAATVLVAAEGDCDAAAVAAAAAAVGHAAAATPAYPQPAGMPRAAGSPAGTADQNASGYSGAGVLNQQQLLTTTTASLDQSAAGGWGGPDVADGQGGAVWAVVERVIGCRRGVNGGWCLQAQLWTAAGGGGGGGTEAEVVGGLHVMAELACGAGSQVMRSVEPGHCLLLLGAQLTNQHAQQLATTTTTTATPGASPPLQPTTHRLAWDESSRGSLFLNVTTLPALLSTPPLYLPLLAPQQSPHNRSPQPLECQDRQQWGQAQGMGGGQRNGVGAAQPCVVCVRLVAVSVHTRRVHRLCGRPVTQSLDLDDLWGDDEVEEFGGGGGGGGGGSGGGGGGGGTAAGQQPAAPAQRADDGFGHEDEGPVGTPGNAHPGLWRCDFCSRELSGGDVCWALAGRACVMAPATHPVIQRQRSAPAWSVASHLNGSQQGRQLESGHQVQSGQSGQLGQGQGRQAGVVHEAGHRVQGQGHRVLSGQGQGREAEEVIHEVELEAGALVTLCGAGADMWRSLSTADRVKRLPELRDANAGPWVGAKAAGHQRVGEQGGGEQGKGALPHASRTFLASLSCGWGDAAAAARLTGCCSPTAGRAGSLGTTSTTEGCASGQGVCGLCCAVHEEAQVASRGLQAVAPSVGVRVVQLRLLLDQATCWLFLIGQAGGATAAGAPA